MKFTMPQGRDYGNRWSSLDGRGTAQEADAAMAELAELHPHLIFSRRLTMSAVKGNIRQRNKRALGLHAPDYDDWNVYARLKPVGGIARSAEPEPEPQS